MSTPHAVTAGYHLGRSEGYWDRPPEEQYSAVMERHENSTGFARDQVVSHYSPGSPPLSTARSLETRGYLAGEYMSNVVGVASIVSEHIHRERYGPLRIDDVFTVTTAVMLRERRLRLEETDWRYAKTVDCFVTKDQRRSDSWQGGPIQRLAAGTNARARSYEVASLAERQVQEAVVQVLQRHDMWTSAEHHHDNNEAIASGTVNILVAEAIRLVLDRMLLEESDLLHQAVAEYADRPRRFAGLLRLFGIKGPSKLR